MILKKKQGKTKEKIKVPKRVQDALPIKDIYEDGIFLENDIFYSKSFRFEDINFLVASEDDKDKMLEKYEEILNSLDSNAVTKITICNRMLNQLDYQNGILIDEKEDALTPYRKEYNKLILDKGKSQQAMVQDKYITITVAEKSIDDARIYFNRVGAELTLQMAKLGSKCIPLNAVERLKIFHSIYRHGEENIYNLSFDDLKLKGHSVKDYICPDYMEIKNDYIRLGDRYARALVIRDLPNFIKDEFISSLCTRCKDMCLSIDILPVETGKAIREIENRLLGIETNITNWQRKQNANNNFSAEIPYDLQLQRDELRDFLEQIMAQDQRMMICTISILHTADTLEKLNQDTKSIKTFGRERLCQIATLKFEQLEGMNTVLPAGRGGLHVKRTLTTQSLAILSPFRVQEILHPNGAYYGQNVVSKNLILIDRRKLLNGNGFLLGVSGSGKSFAGKQEIVYQMLSSEADIIIIDPEKEYGPLVSALGGEIIEISATSNNHINALDLNKEYGDINPIIEKSQFIQSLCEQIITGNKFSKGQQSIIDRCTESVYRYYAQGNFQGVPPTLNDFRDELLKQPEPEAKELALELELFTKGSLNTFAKQTNVDVKNRLICYDIMDLGEQLKPVGMLVILDSILNRITANRKKGKETFIFIDEIYLMFLHEYSAQFLFKLWKRVRKYGAFCTGITQDVGDLLESHIARTMLANSELVVMLNQSGDNREELARLLNISNTQLSYISDVEAGCGLIRVGSSLVPFENKYPACTELYRLMSTKPGERNQNE